MMAGRKFERKKEGWGVTREVQTLMKKFVATTLKRGQFLQFLDILNSQPTLQKFMPLKEKFFSVPILFYIHL